MPRKTSTKPATAARLAGTTTNTTAALDFESELALSYCAAWLHREGRFKVPTSGIVRRALVLYAKHLSGTEYPVIEVSEAARACRPQARDRGDELDALLRLSAVSPGEPLPSFGHVLTGSSSAFPVQQINERVDALIADVSKTRWGRLKRIVTPPHDRLSQQP